MTWQKSKLNYTSHKREYLLVRRDVPPTLITGYRSVIMRQRPDDLPDIHSRASEDGEAVFVKVDNFRRIAGQRAVVRYTQGR